MRKLSLNPEDLRVESFDTATPPGSRGRGTVFGNDSDGGQSRYCTIPISCQGSCGPDTDYPCATFDDPCTQSPDTCG